MHGLNRVDGDFSAVRPRAIVALLSRPNRIEGALDIAPGATVSVPADRKVRVISKGWGARVRQFGVGRRQIFNFLLPGDSIVAPSAGEAPPANTIVALTAMQLVPIESIEPGGLGSDFRSLETSCSSAAREEISLVLDHLMRLGQQTAVERTAHLLLELASRLAAVRQAENDSFVLPIKQECLAQALGMSAVHLNRTLQKMKADGLIATQGSRLFIKQPGRMRRLCAFRSDVGEPRTFAGRALAS